MFTWICPQCGGEVLPSYSECPRCAEKRGQQAQPQQQPPAAPQPPVQAAPPVQQTAFAPPQQQPVFAPPQQPVFAAQPQQPVFAPPPPPQQAPQAAQPAPAPQYAAAPTPLMDNPSTWTPQAQQQAAQQQMYYLDNNNKKKMPPWLAGILVVLVMGGGFYGLYRFVGGKNGSSPAAVKTEKAGEAAITGHPYAKHIELAALRLIEQGKKTKLRFTVVNHSAADLAGVGLRVTLTTTAASADEPPLSVFDAKPGDLPAYGTKDVEVEIKTEKRVYELPDWQFLRVKFELTAPK